MLVYVPYFIMSDDAISGGTLTVKEAKSPMMQNFPFFPGAAESHFSILQSKNCEKKTHTMIKSVSDEPASYVRKFVGLGSPKIEKVLLTKKEDFYMPPHWLDKIGNKKVILFSTAFIGKRYGAAYFSKLAQIISFIFSCEDVVFWWRPHPLTREAIATTNEQFLATYDKTVALAKASPTVIFDDTHDMHRAITWSDACYGGGGSMPLIYSFTGRPTMRLNSKVKNIEEVGADDFAIADFLANDHAVKPLLNYASVERDTMHLGHFVHFVLWSANTDDGAAWVKNRKQVVCDTYANESATAGTAIFNHVKKMWMK